MRRLVVRGGEFMLELVGDDCLALLLLRKLIGIAADPVLNAYLHRAQREHLLETPKPNLPCSEGVVTYERRPFGVGHSQIGLLQRLAIERAEIARNRRADPFAGTETLLSANIER
jgi:hypothetical protein